MSDENEVRYRITPKGLLIAELGEYDGDRVWEHLAQYARDVLAYREDRGIPCIVLKGGGEFIAVHLLPPSPSIPATTTPPAPSPSASPAAATLTPPTSAIPVAALTGNTVPTEPARGTAAIRGRRCWGFNVDCVHSGALLVAYL